nr:RecBCD enzyme subunit RecB [Candidatus Anoxychlamydiales bacterium]
ISKNFKKLSKFKNDNFVDQLDLLIAIINKRESTKSDFKILLRYKLNIFEFLDEKNKKVKAKDFVLPDFFQKAKKELYPIITDAIDPNILFYRLAKDISKEVALYLEKDEVFSYDKILTKMREALKNKKFKEKVQLIYKAAIIDEFQDTDPIQFEIFENLFLKNKNLLAFYLIGDPKQSIYSFRKANLYTYIEATKKIDEINYLDTNYRSSKSLIASLNALFSSSFSKNWLKLPQKNDSLKYIPIKAGLGLDFDFQDSFKSLHFFIAEDNFSKKKWPTDEIEQKYFAFITNEILKLKKKLQFEESSFAVLVKDRYQAARLKNYFQKFSISSITTRGSSLKGSIALKAMKEFLDAVISPSDLNKVKIALLGAFIGFNAEKIINLDLMKNPEIIEEFYKLKIALKKGLGFFFNLFFKATFDQKTILENIASKKDIHFYFDVISLIELIAIEKNIVSIQSFFEKLETLDSDDEKLQNNQVFETGVQILTTFMSKGLEYDIVFALGLANRSKINPLNEDIEEIDAEKMRQLYVALTRAKYRVYAPIALDLKEKEIQDGTYSCMEYFLS